MVFALFGPQFPHLYNNRLRPGNSADKKFKLAHKGVQTEENQKGVDSPDE